MDNKIANTKYGQPHGWRLLVQDFSQAQGFNPERLAAQCGLSLEQVKELWEDPTADVSLSTLDAIAQVLHIRINDLIEDVAEAQEPDQAKR